MRRHCSHDELLVERVARIEKAIELQAVETERRLEILNHENTRVSRIAETTISTEKFADYAESVRKAMGVANRDYRAEHTELVTRIERIEGSDRAQARLNADIQERRKRALQWQIAVVGSVVAVLAVALRLTFGG